MCPFKRHIKILPPMDLRLWINCFLSFLMPVRWANNVLAEFPAPNQNRYIQVTQNIDQARNWFCGSNFFRTVFCWPNWYWQRACWISWHEVQREALSWQNLKSCVLGEWARAQPCVLSDHDRRPAVWRPARSPAVGTFEPQPLVSRAMAYK